MAKRLQTKNFVVENAEKDIISFIQTVEAKKEVSMEEEHKKN